MALFFNKEVQANTLFSAITQNYNSISAAASAAAAASPKLVAWIQWWPAASYGPFTDGAAISIEFPAYKRQLTAAAGASILDLGRLQSFVSANQTSQPLYPAADAVYIYANQTDILRAMLKVRPLFPSPFQDLKSVFPLCFYILMRTRVCDSP